MERLFALFCHNSHDVLTKKEEFHKLRLVEVYL